MRKFLTQYTRGESMKLKRTSINPETASGRKVYHVVFEALMSEKAFLELERKVDSHEYLEVTALTPIKAPNTDYGGDMDIY